jgi:hypothetical protein
MVNNIILTHPSTNGRSWEASFAPDDGLCLNRLQYGPHSLLHANGGRLIGPHYGAHKPSLAEQTLEHGSVRYAPWHIVDSTEHSLRAEITGDAIWQDRQLADWQGQKFKMTYQAHLNAHGLTIACSVVGETDTLIGIDYPWLLPAGICSLRVHSGEKTSHFNVQGTGSQTTSLNLSTEPWHKLLDPSPTPLGADISLVTPQYEIQVSYSYVAIQPMTAQDPLHPNLTVSSLHVAITFVELML